MIIQIMWPDGRVAKTFDTVSYRGERLQVALLECYSDRVERAGDPVHNERIREEFRRQAQELWELLEAFFPGHTSRIH